MSKAFGKLPYIRPISWKEYHLLANLQTVYIILLRMTKFLNCVFKHPVKMFLIMVKCMRWKRFSRQMLRF